MVSKMKMYDDEVCNELVRCGYYVFRRYGNLMFGIHSNMKGKGFSAMSDMCMYIPHNVVAYTNFIDKLDTLGDKVKQDFAQAKAIFFNALTKAGEFERFAAEHNSPCSYCFYGHQCNSSCPYMREVCDDDIFA